MIYLWASASKRKKKENKLVCKNVTQSPSEYIGKREGLKKKEADEPGTNEWHEEDEGGWGGESLSRLMISVTSATKHIIMSKQPSQVDMKTKHNLGP